MNSVIPFRKHPLSAAIHAYCYALFLAHAGAASVALAGPVGGDVVGGSGSIHQAGRDTTINQASQNLAINWQSFNVLADERVRFIQPNSSSIALNRILSNNGSVIAGRIDANGQVILANPNGVLFTPTATINVGGIIATGLDIAPSDFMNGQYIFSEVLGTEGSVINRGMINASVGGNVALLGKNVQNEGMIAANLGSVTLAAGKEAVLTFDPNGVLGVRVSKEVLQSELGVDPAVVNSGQIEAAGGRVLLTASTSREVFSQAVNTHGIESATSVVVHEDGSFTLGDGADVANSGRIDVSSNSSQNSGRIVLLGENVTSRGELRADGVHRGGEIEVHAQDTTLLTGQSLTTAQSTTGAGGTIKLLGDKVGLADQSAVNASATHGGGQVFVGGDQEGKNPALRNASFVFQSEQSQINADALDQGRGGTLITFAEDTARIYGTLSARGGPNGGDGGFIETSGLRGLEVLNAPDAGATFGAPGLWLIDPYNLTISNGLTGNVGTAPNFSASGSGANINSSTLESALRNNSNVTISTGSSGTEFGDITFANSADIDFHNAGTTTLTLNAARNITFQAGSAIYDGNNSGSDRLSIVMNAAGSVSFEGATTSRDGAFIETKNGNINVNAGGSVTLGVSSGTRPVATIVTQGGSLTVGSSGSPVTSFTNNGVINSSGPQTVAGGNIDVFSAGAVTVGSLTANGGGGSGNPNGGRIAITGSTISLNADLDARGGAQGGAVSFTGPVTIDNSVNINTSGTTRGNITFSGTVDNQGGTANALSLTGRDITFGGALGTGSRLGTLSISATGAVNAGSLRSTSLSLSQSNSFRAATIDTASSLLPGGAVSVSSSGILEVGGIDASSTGVGMVGGIVRLNGSQITLNGDINTQGAGLSQLVELTPSSSGLNSITLAHTGNFTSPVTITGGSSQVTLNAANRDNAWTISGDGIGSLASGVSFSGVTTLNGNNGDDAFTFTANPGAGFATQINGGGQGSAGDSVRFVGLNAIQVPINRFTGIESLVGVNDGAPTNVNVSTLIGADSPNTWSLSGTNSGTYNSTQAFSAFNNLTGGSGSDTFTLLATGVVTGTIDGGGGGNTLVARQGVANVWTFNPLGGGSVRQGNEATPYVANFTNIQTYNAGASDWANVSQLSSVNVGSYNNFVGLIATGGTTSLVGTSGADVFTFQSVTGPDNNPSGGENDGTVAFGATSMRFIDFQNLDGGDGDDRFIMTAGGSVTGTIFGGGGSDTLVGRDNDSTWTLGGPSLGRNAGSVSQTGATSPYVANFRDVENLNGGAGADSFSVIGAGGLSGLLQGGTGSNVFDISGATTPTDVRLLATAPTGAVANPAGVLSVFQIGSLIGGAAHTLSGPNATVSWTINGADFGTVRLNAGTPSEQISSFTGFGTLQGGNGDDNFVINTAASLSMTIDGGDQATRDTVDYSRPGPVTVNFGRGAFAGIANIEAVRGNGTNSTLVGPTSDDATWTLSDVNTGTITSRSFTMGFEGFNYLTGGSGDDTFTISGGSLRNVSSGVAGLIRGGGGTNTVNIDLSGTGVFSGQINYLGSTAGTDRIDVRNTSTNRYDATYRPVVSVSDPNNSTNSGNYEQLSYRYQNAGSGINSALDVNFRNVNSVTSQLAVDTLTVNGALIGATSLDNGSFLAGSGQRVTYSNVNNLTANGGSAIVVNNTNLSGTLTLANSPVATISGLNAGGLVLSGIGEAGTAGTRLTTDVGSLSVLNSGPVFLSEANSLSLGPFNTNGSVDIVAGGTISNSGGLVSSGQWTLTANNADISLTDAQNALSGPLTLSANAVQLTNSSTTEFASVTAGSLNVISGGNITQSGPLTITGTTTLEAPGANITLTDATNSFSAVNVNNAAEVTLTTRGRIDSGAMRADSISLATVGGIGNLSTQTRRLVINNALPTVGNPTTAGDVNVTNTGTATVSITNVGNITLLNLGDLIVERLYTNGGRYLVSGPLIGDVTVTSRNGTIRAYEANPSYAGAFLHAAETAPDIVGQNLTVVADFGMGRQGRPVSIRVNDVFTYIGGRGYVYYFGARPAQIITQGDLITFSSLDSLSNQQLIEIESLEEFDPAIFTAVRNYYHEDVAILMPADQRLDGQKEDEEEEQKSKQ